MQQDFAQSQLSGNPNNLTASIVVQNSQETNDVKANSPLHQQQTRKRKQAFSLASHNTKDK